ncbi:MAG: DUF1127 domain-containing protein [Pseudomonadota bacterium]
MTFEKSISEEYVPIQQAIKRCGSERITDMAYYTSVVSSGASAPSLKGFVSSAHKAYVAWNTRRITSKHLSKMTNRQLEDIGLTRGDAQRF